MLMPLAVLTEMHLILLLIIVLLLFGGKKLPELARGLGEAMKEFKKAQRDVHEDTSPSPKPDQTAQGTSVAPNNPPPKSS